MQGRIQGAPLTTKNEAPAPKFYKTEAPEWQFLGRSWSGAPPDQILDLPLDMHGDICVGTEA